MLEIAHVPGITVAQIELAQIQKSARKTKSEIICLMKDIVGMRKVSEETKVLIWVSVSFIRIFQVQSEHVFIDNRRVSPSLRAPKRSVQTAIGVEISQPFVRRRMNQFSKIVGNELELFHSREWFDESSFQDGVEGSLSNNGPGHIEEATLENVLEGGSVDVRDEKR